MFKGTYRHTLDSKGRLALPAKFRNQMPDGGTIAAWTEKSLGIWPTAAWNEMIAAIRTHMNNHPTGRNFARSLFGDADDITFDAQGRFPLNAELRRIAGLKLDAPAVVVGVGEHLEIWAPEEWDHYRAASEPLESLLAEIPGLPSF